MKRIEEASSLQHFHPFHESTYGFALTLRRMDHDEIDTENRSYMLNFLMENYLTFRVLTYHILE